jgi:hypothetical protein
MIFKNFSFEVMRHRQNCHNPMLPWTQDDAAPQAPSGRTEMRLAVDWL